MSLKIFLVSSFLIALCAGQHANPADLDPLDEINEDEFEEYFHVDRPEDPEEYEKRKEALKENEKEIHEINEEFEAGDISWFDAVNEFSDLPADEFVAQHTGAIANFTEGRGLLNPLEADVVDEESEAYFREVEARASPPSVYDSRKYGFVSPVKNQRTCGSCVAFSSMATVETCFRKVTGVFGDYAEQQMVDCGYKKNGANGCNGAPPHAYIKYWGDNKLTLAHESQYPYLNDQPKLYCPRLPSYNQGAKITGSYYSYQANEDLIKKLVYENGAAVVTVKSQGPFQKYKGGIFAGCPPNTKTDHAVTVVGYGRERGTDYWIIKNSWGEGWGENGFIRLKRGVGMCGIGQNVAVIKCAKSSGPTDRPLTTKKPCLDKYSNCATLAKSSCWQDKIKNSCAKSCGMCPGMTPARSSYCYDKWSNCASMKNRCSQTNIKQGCKISCRQC